jgi:predicted metal-binding protein
MTQPVIYVCRSCAFSATQREHQGQRGGAHLLAALLQMQRLARAECKIETTDCLSACNRACVVAFSAPRKYTLMFGDLSPFDSAIAILQMAEQYHASPDGVVPRQNRPDILKKGILARIPPLPS